MKNAQDPSIDTQEAIIFGENVLYTEDFLQVWRSLTSQKQRIVRKKVELLIANPRHRSLKVHRLQRADSEVWECYLIDSWPHRLLFQYQDNKIFLVQMGGHQVVNRCHVTKFVGKTATA